MPMSTCRPRASSREWRRDRLGRRCRELDPHRDGRALALTRGRAANERLAELDIDARIDHRSLEAQGTALEPQSQIGAPAKRIEVRDTMAKRPKLPRRDDREIGTRQWRGSSPIRSARWTPSRSSNRPSRSVTWRSSCTGTATGRAIQRTSWPRMRDAPDLVETRHGLGERSRFTTRDMIEAERRLHHTAKLMAERERHEANDADRQAALTRAARPWSCPRASRPTRCACPPARTRSEIVVGHAGRERARRRAWRGSSLGSSGR